MNAKLVCALLACMCLLACKTRQEKILHFEIKKGADVRSSLESAFGKSDTTIAFCNKDTAYLYRVESGCVEWKTIHGDAIGYQSMLNPTCTSEEGRYVVGEGTDNEIMKQWKRELDSVLTLEGEDSIICASAVGHWNNYLFCFSKKDSGQLGEIYQDVLNLGIQDKNSIGSPYCRSIGYIVEVKLGDFKRAFVLGGVNFPDSGYVNLMRKLKEANKIHYQISRRADFQVNYIKAKWN